MPYKIILGKFLEFFQFLFKTFGNRFVDSGLGCEDPDHYRLFLALLPASAEDACIALMENLLDPVIINIQASWVKMGPDGAAACLAAGANDVGGTLMNESITRAAGAAHGQEMTSGALESLIRKAGRTPMQRTTLYAAAQPFAHSMAEPPDEPSVRIRMLAAE